MTELHPIEKLNEAVADFCAATDEEGVMSGFVLAFQMSSFTDDAEFAPLLTSTNYTVGTSTSLETAVGLSAILSKRLERIAFGEDGGPYSGVEDDD